MPNPCAKQILTGLPPAFIVAAGLDPLCDDSENYADKLRDANIPVHVRHEPFLVHAFLRARHMSEPAEKVFLLL